MIELTPEFLNTLVRLPLFRGLDGAGLEWVARRMYQRIFPAGVAVLVAEQPGEAVYIILQGVVKIVIDHADKKPVVLSMMGAGEILGEISLLDSAGHSASAVALKDTLMLWMDKSSFHQMLDNFPIVSRNLVTILSMRLRRNNELIQALATMDTYGRVARQLLVFAGNHVTSEEKNPVTLSINITQSDIADLVGASRRRVNQVMVAFREQGLISINDAGKITVLQREGLMKFCK
jgi:CRP/FNR family cyclic AMP-dependent transcriptional regulator